MAKVSLNKASKETGVTLVTLSRWVKKGKVSAEKQKSGGYLMDTSEYDRIISLMKASPNMKHNIKGTMLEIETPKETPNDTSGLQVEVEFLRERLEDKEKVIEDLRNDRDHWKDNSQQAQDIIAQQTRLLEHHQDRTSSEATEKPIEGQESDLASQGHKNASKPSYDLLKLFMAVVIGILLVLVTKDYWLPITQSWIK